MDKIAVFLLSFLVYSNGFAQDYGLIQEDNPVQWVHYIEQVSDSTYLLVMEAKLDPQWHLYSQFSDPNGSMPAEFEFIEETSVYTRLGGVTEGKTFKAYNEVFEVEETYFENSARFTQKIQLNQAYPDNIRVNVYYQVCKQVCIPGTQEFIFSWTGAPKMNTEVAQGNRDLTLSANLILDLKDRAILNQGTNASDTPSEMNWWSVFALGFLGGLIALLTPCVFPMIPLTVSFFTKHSGSRKKGLLSALFYGFSIVFIYMLLSTPFHLVDGIDSQFLNALATNVWLNFFFFLIFLVFAFSFFGFYELTLPASWASKADTASSNKGGFVGIFFMAVTLAIVSFSCTGPILGGLLGSTALAAGNVAWNLSLGMTGFGLALALPFALFALFPSWLNHLPKSGRWMETVKTVLGFLELALALKFLSNADLVGHWGILKREVFLAIWLVLALLLSGYLFGFFKFKSGNASKSRSIWSNLFGLLAFVFAAYLAFGIITRKPLTMLSGFPPPDFYTLRPQETDCPLGLDCVKDFETGLQKARDSGKPILLDFTGWACVNCRKMEEQVWSRPEIFKLLNEQYVLVSLYVDDRKLLPISQQFVFKFNNGQSKQIKTVGDLWSTFQTYNFGTLSQPYYIQITHNLEVLHAPIQNTNAEEYLNWLTQGLQNFKQLLKRSDQFAFKLSGAL
ncbi:MAG: hypothetical protein RLZZ241_1837 [Bacteroidota bacterium]|jgi:thiol:disulfide interchange protein DsbD